MTSGIPTYQLIKKTKYQFLKKFVEYGQLYQKIIKKLPFSKITISVKLKKKTNINNNQRYRVEIRIR